MLAGPQAPAAPATSEAAPAASRRIEPAALVLLAVLAIVWSWWAAKDGAFFETVLLPGTILLCATTALLAWAAPWRGSLRPSQPAIIALASLTGLGAWAALSALWSPLPDVAIDDGQRILTYALAFGLGIWLCGLLAGRLQLTLAPLAIAGAFAGILAVAGMLTSDHVGLYFEDGTLYFPLGYRNANAAFFAIALWPALGLASHRATAWPVRALALATATLCLELAMLSQSRGALAGGVAALGVYLLLSEDRARRLGWLALAVLPALLILPALIDLYRAGTAEDVALRSALGEMRGAGRAVALTCAGSLVIGATAALLGRRIPASPRRVKTANRAALGGLAVVALAGSLAFLVAVGDPADWIDKRVSQLASGEDAELGNESSRFSSLNVATRRPAIWRVALIEAREHPVLGVGGGGFLDSYLREREQNSPDSVRDAHSVELENLSELGVPGLLLFAGAIGAAAVGATRVRRLGPDPALVSTVALTAGAYWLAHASFDWFWPYPVVTAPVLALLGSACAAGVGDTDSSRQGRGRRWLAAGAIALAISSVPPFLSDRYMSDAYDEWRSDASRAYDDLDRAQALNPLSVYPVLAEGAIARANGDRARAVDAFRRAAAKRPEEWAAHYNLAELYARSSPRLARRELAIAKRLNPYDFEVLALEERFAARERGGRE